ncbi:hypothetical protein [Flavobacterium sp. 9]|uniref:hypothetical protein n=1 Tax=Flavobacterium sp. 9 TaxID=2035198 RepID=UPI0011982168|nr:hypothetical protein [Flavobacterium sp. 9]
MGAFSRYPLQSFVPNTGTKGFSLLSGLGSDCLQLAPFGCGDRNRIIFYKIYGRFEEIGVLYLLSVFNWLYEFGLDVVLGIDGKIHLIFYIILLQIQIPEIEMESNLTAITFYTISQEIITNIVMCENQLRKVLIRKRI